MIVFKKNINSFVKESKVYLKAFPGAKTNQLIYQIIPVSQGNNYDALAIHGVTRWHQ